MEASSEVAQYPLFYWKIEEMNKPQKDRHQFSPSEQIQCLADSIECLFESVDKMNVEDKDIAVVIGPTRAGKGTLLSALKGQKMKFFEKKAIANAFEACSKYFMAPVDEQG